MKRPELTLETVSLAREPGFEPDFEPGFKPGFWEIFAEGAASAASGFVLAHLGARKGPLLWIQDHLSARENGVPSAIGAGREFGANPNILRVQASKAIDVLWAMEEGLRCSQISGIIGEIWGDPPALTFTATKRLALRCERSGIPITLIRSACEATLSAARERFRIQALPSAPHPYDPRAPGAPQWHVTLFKSRTQAPGQWDMTYDRTTNRLHLSAPLRDGTMAENTWQRQAG